VLPGTDEETAAETTTRLVQAFEAPIATIEGSHNLGASVGVATYRAGVTLEGLLNEADEAMFVRKQQRKSDRSLASSKSTRMVENAMAAGRIEVLYQPLVSGAGDTVSLSGAEALVRIRRSDGELVAPQGFLDDVETLPVGRDLDRYVMRLAIARLAGWVRAGAVPLDFELSVNCSPAFIIDPTAPSFVHDRLAEYGLDSCNLILEISERASKIEPAIVGSLRELGIRLAVDDLGIDHSNFDRLIDSGASIAKIDQRWVRPDEPGPQTQIVLEHLVSLCSALNCEIIAEGVETAEQLQQMRQLGISTFQGYLFAPPLTPEEFEERFFAVAADSFRHSVR